MADVERITPPVPTLPAPVGRNIGSNRRQRQPLEPPVRRAPPHDDERSDRNDPTEHIDEYV